MKGRKVFIISLIVISLIVIVLMPFLGSNSSTNGPFRVEEDRIVVITLAGPIQESSGSLLHGGVISPRYVQSQLKQAADDRSIKGVILRIETPGGAIAASQEIAAMVKKFEKPIVVSMGDMAASGGYYISAPAQGIVAQPGTMTGSIGVISSLINMEGLYEMLGLEVEVFKSGEHKDMFSRTLTEEEKEIMQAISDEAYRQFTEEVAESRNIPIGRVLELATGQLYLGTQALELGLVDRLGGIEEAIDYLAELNGFENPVRYEFPQPSLFSQFFDYGYQVMVVLEKAIGGPEMIMLEMLREGVPPDIRYQVR